MKFFKSDEQEIRFYVIGTFVALLVNIVLSILIHL